MEDRHINFLHKQIPTIEPQKTPKKKKWVFIITLILVLILSITGYVSAKKMVFESPLEYDPITLEPKKPDGFFKKISYLVFGRDTTLQGEQHDRITILLLGMGGPGHDGPYLTDTIMIASLQPSTNQIALISIPRDMGVSIPNYGTYKINHANHFGEQEQSNWGGAFATKVISDTFGLDIPYYIRVDFKAFEEIIDEVGGVRIDVDRAFTDYMYPAPNELYQTISYAKGPQTMNGDSALKFVRSRHGNNGEGSDFARAARQQKVMLALKEKVLSFSTLTNPIRIKHVIDALERHMTTNMDFEEIMTFVRMAKQLDTTEIRSLVLDNGPTGYLTDTTNNAGSYLLVPKTGSYDDINYAIEHIFDEQTTVVPLQIDETPAQEEPAYDDITIEVQNGTWRVGLASRVKQLLLDEEFFVEGVGNTPLEAKPITTSGVYILSESVDQTLTTKLTGLLNMSIKTTIPDYISPDSQSDILVILGDDFIE